MQSCWRNGKRDQAKMRHFAAQHFRSKVGQLPPHNPECQVQATLSGRNPNFNVGTPPLAEQMLALLVEDSGADSLFAIDPNLPMLVLSHACAFSLRQPSAEPSRLHVQSPSPDRDSTPPDACLSAPRARSQLHDFEVAKKYCARLGKTRAPFTPIHVIHHYIAYGF